MRIEVPETPSPISSTSSLYSTILSTNTVDLDDPDFVNDKTQSWKDPVPLYQVCNPYANSLWYSSDGGTQAISKIQERINSIKRKRPKTFEIPTRSDFKSNKHVDSPINNEHFLGSFDDIKCNAPKYKGLDKKFESKYRKIFKELVVTELKYHEDLELVDKIYRSTLHNTRMFQNVIGHDEESKIFSNIDTIIGLSQFLLKELENALKNNMKESSDEQSALCMELDLCNVENIDIGELMLSFFARVKVAYASYVANHPLQIEEISKCILSSGPKASKWLDKCAYLAKSKSECWNLESLLVKPIQRLSMYKLLLCDFESSCDDQVPSVFKKNILMAREFLEKTLDEFNTFETLSDTTELKDEIAKEANSSRQEFIQMVKDFKKSYKGLQKFKHGIIESLPSFTEFVIKQKNMSETLNLMMGPGSADVENHYIKSAYAIYFEKVCLLEEKTKLVVVGIEEKVVKAVKLLLEICDVVKLKINKHSSYRNSYVRYIDSEKHRNESKSYSIFSSTHTESEAQKYIVLGNQLKEELPKLNQSMDRFVQLIILNYIFLVSQWFKMLAGDKQINQYQEMVKDGLIVKDNFDIIQMYSDAKLRTILALKEIGSQTLYPYSSSGTPISAISDLQFKMSSSRAVRRLFPV